MTDYVIRIVVNGTDNASGPLGRVGSSLGSMGNIVGGILGAQLLTRLAQGIMETGRQALESYASYERLGMALTSLTARELLNSGATNSMAEAMKMAAPLAAELQGWITKLAIQSPFKQEDIANSFRMALAYGFTTDEAKRLTQAMVDFSAGSGASSETMNRVALALGQIKAKGKLAGQEIMQLTEAGLPVRDILAKAFGVTTAELETMISKGLVPADKAIEAITKSLEEDFGGAAAAQATTFSGLVSSLEDIKTVGLREFFTGTFEAIQPYVEKFVEKFSSEEFMAGLKKKGEDLGKFTNDVITFLTPVFDLFNGKSKIDLGGFSDAFKNIQEAGNTFSEFWKENGPAIIATVGDIGQNLKDTFGPVVLDIINFFSEKLLGLSEWFVANGPLIQDFLIVMAEYWAWLGEAIAGTWEWIEPILNGLFELILGLGTIIMQVATGDWAGAWETMKQTASIVWEALQTAFWAFLNWIAETMGSSLAEIGAVWSNNWAMLQSILATWWEQYKATITEYLAAVIVSFITWFAQITSNWSSSWNNLKEIVTAIWDSIKTMFDTKLKEIKTGIANKVAEFKQLGGDIVRGLEAGIKSAFVGLIATFQGLINQLPDAVKDILGIASPSKVFAGFGKNIMEGWAEGLVQNATMPINATIKTSDALKNAAVGNTKSTVYNVNINNPAQSASAVRDDIQLLQLMTGAG